MKTGKQEAVVPTPASRMSTLSADWPPGELICAMDSVTSYMRTALKFVSPVQTSPGSRPRIPQPARPLRLGVRRPPTPHPSFQLPPSGHTAPAQGNEPEPGWDVAPVPAPNDTVQLRGALSILCSGNACGLSPARTQQIPTSTLPCSPAHPPHLLLKIPGNLTTSFPCFRILRHILSAPWNTTNLLSGREATWTPRPTPASLRTLRSFFFHGDVLSCQQVLLPRAS